RGNKEPRERLPPIPGFRGPWAVGALSLTSPIRLIGGKSVEPDVHIVAIDTETCALGPGRDRLVQFCAQQLDGDLKVLDTWTELVNPGRPIPAAATAIHGITNEMVRTAQPFVLLAPRLRRLFRPDTVFM